MRMTAVALPALVLGACGQAPDSVLDPDRWASYQSRFLSPDGRVIDTGRDGISHSEGQAYAMLLAEAAGDRRGFERIWRWTRTRLQVRTDALLAWKWDPSSASVADSNNATDADLLAAWALLRAAARWGEDAFRDQARDMLADVERLLVAGSDFGPMLLPGRSGFVHDGATTVNLSYWVYPALTEFARLDPDGPWAALRTSGLALTDAARSGEPGLPPDWVVAAEPPTASRLFPARFGYEALRIPLYACWDGLCSHPAVQRIAAFWAAAEHPPAWLDLVDGTAAPYGLGTGGMAVRRLLLDGRAGPGTTEGPRPGDDPDYYDATLMLLAEIADHERRS